MPIAPASSGFSSSPLNDLPMKRETGGSILSAAQTPPLRAPHVDRSKVNPEIIKAAEGMETMFMDYLMKVMRETVPKNDMDLENPATQIYTGMLDSEYAAKAAHAGGVGLSDTIIAYMAPESYTFPKGQMTAPGHVSAQVAAAKVSNPETKASENLSDQGHAVLEDDRRTGGTK